MVLGNEGSVDVPPRRRRHRRHRRRVSAVITSRACLCSTTGHGVFVNNRGDIAIPAFAWELIERHA